MNSNWLSIMLMGVSFIVTTILYPYVLAFARRHNIVDNPSARKLQRVPVPVMGGTVVFIGFFITVMVGMFILPSERIIKITSLLFVMYLIGVWDDIKDVSPAFRFLAELVIVWLMILLLDVEINDFYGFMGVQSIPDTVSVPLSLVAGVGIMNAINLIDGVDGYCSSYGVMACTVFAVVFYQAGAWPAFTLALIVIGAILPFFFHNVFGKTSKMFLGDGGSLMLGTLLSFFTFNVMTSGSLCDEALRDTGLSLPALCLAVLAVPVFDTLKVMIFRAANGQSPFHPDKTHLHHLYIEMDFSHLATSGMIVLMNIMIIGILLLSWWLGAGATAQVLIVIAVSMLYVWGFYFFMEGQRRKNDGEGSALWKRWCNRGKGTQLSSKPLWLFIRKIVDSKMLGAGWEKQQEGDVVPPVAIKPRFDPRVGDVHSDPGSKGLPL